MNLKGSMIYKKDEKNTKNDDIDNVDIKEK